MTWALLILGGWLLLLLLAQRQFFHIALLGFPGVVMHELMHLLVGVVLLARPVSLNLIPRRVGNQWQFGSVSFSGLTIFNAAPVAYAPLLLLGAAWFCFHRWMLPLVLEHHYLEAAAGGYLIACAILYSVPSMTDLKVGGISTLFWALIAGVGWWFRTWPH
jgi:hypothetical protein